MASNKTFAIVFCVVVVLIVVSSGVFIASRFTGGSGDSAGSPTSPSASRATADASTQPTEATSTGPGSRPSRPASTPSVPAACNGCFPGLTVNGILRQFKAKGYACKEDRILGIECAKGNLEVDIDRDYTQKNQIRDIDVGGRATSKGEYPHGPRDAYATMLAGLPGVLPMFIADATVRQQIVAFATKNAAHAATGPSALRDGKAGNYRISCQGVHGFTVRKNGKSASSYSTSVSIYGPSAY